MGPPRGHSGIHHFSARASCRRVFYIHLMVMQKLYFSCFKDFAPNLEIPPCFGPSLQQPVLPAHSPPDPSASSRCTKPASATFDAISVPNIKPTITHWASKLALDASSDGFGKESASENPHCKLSYISVHICTTPYANTSPLYLPLSNASTFSTLTQYAPVYTVHFGSLHWT
jgi:hypothetical protein